MTLKQVIKSISFKSIPSLVGLALYYPRFVIPTLNATRKTMKIAQKEYGNAHKGNTKANAFRHGLWNILITRNCLKWNDDFEKVLGWTEKITTKHEDLAPNPPLERAMDLHNNQVGRFLCKTLVEFQEAEIIAEVKKHAEKAIKIKDKTEIENHSTDLIYLNE